MNIDSDAILKAIRECVDAAEKRGVDVKVVIVEGAFFPGERDTITITAKKQTPAAAKAA